MKHTQLSNLFLDQSKDLFWMINSDFQLVYANKAYLNFLKDINGLEKKQNNSLTNEWFGIDDKEKWKPFYEKALQGEYLETEEHYYHAIANDIKYIQVTFQPLLDEDRKIIAVACQSKDITRIVKQRSEANQLIDASLDVFCTINEHGEFIYVSASSAKQWGYLPEELIGSAFRNYLLEEDLAKTKEISDAVLSGQELKSFVNRYKKKDGGIAYNLWSVRWDFSSKLLYCVARDAKEIIENEQKIQLSEQRFKALVQEGLDMIAIMDLEGIYKYVSPNSKFILGINPEEFIGTNPLGFIHPDDIEHTSASLQNITTQNRLIVDPFRFKNHKNEWRWVETTLTNMLDNPAIKGIVANSRDITDKFKEQHKLKLLESVITHTTDAILITGVATQYETNTKIIYVNNAFTKMTGYTAEEVIGKSPKILQGPHSDREELAKLERSLRNWEPCDTTTINYKKNGEEFWINFTVTPVADEKGCYTHWIAIEWDVTEQKNKELENELLAQISLNFNAENDYISATKKLCNLIGAFGKFDWVELWTTNLEKSQMQLFSYFVTEPANEKFYEFSSDFVAFKKYEGFGGKVWAEREQLLWDDIEMNAGFSRRDAATEIGLKSVLGIPLVYDDEVVGVLKIGTKYNANYLKNYAKIFQKLEGFIGSELSRKKMENDLNHWFNAIPDILCLLDLEGRFLKMNKSGCALLGYQEEDILYHSFDEFAHPHDAGIFTNEVMKLKKEETTFKFENRYITKNGEIIWLSWYCNAAMKEGIIYATSKNITEEKEIRELNRQVSSLAKIGSWEVDFIKQTVFWSDEIHLLHETDPKLFLPNCQECIEFYREDFHNLVKSSIDHAIISGQSFDFEAVIVTSKKNERWVRAIGNADLLDGKCVRIYGSFQDIHQRKEAEVRLQSLADNLPGVVYQYLIYPDGTDSLKYVTKGSELVWGYTTDEVLQNNRLIWERIIAGGEFEKVRKSIADSIKFKTNWTNRWKYLMPNGEVRTHLGYGSPNFLADGTVLFNSLVLDVTREAANELLLEQYALELERSNEELEQYAFVTSHDLQEPLRMITSFMDLLERKYGNLLDEKGHQYIYFATDGAKRMKRIILDLLDYSRAKKPPEGKEDVNLNEIVSEFKQLRRKLIAEKKALFEFGELPVLNTYKAAITQIIHCLLDNALKYSKENVEPKVHLDAVENKNAWEFSVKDNGIGIDPQFFNKIFVIFQRLHNKDRYDGTGIGLPIAKRHVEFLGGRIWLESSQGQGTIFYFTIPKN